MLALEAGLEPPHIDSVLRVFYTRKYTIHRGGTKSRILADGTEKFYEPKYSSEYKIKQLISTLDILVLGGVDESDNGSDNCSAKGGGEVGSGPDFQGAVRPGVDG